MARKKLLQDIKHNPARIYRSPADVLRDRRFDDSERLEILRAWRQMQFDAEAIDAVIGHLESRFYPATHHAAE